MHQTILLPNGLRILTEEVPGARSAALGFFVGTGSRHEKAGESGAAHFIEHMSFKGTRDRTAGDLARETDALGGQLNAYTTKECTCYYVRCLDRHLDRAAELLCDMLLCSAFREEDVELERGVILEEIGMYQDSPEDLAAERLAGAVFRGSSLARPILGRRATLEKMTGAWLREYQRTHYRPGRIVAALAGNFTQAAVDRLARRLGELEPGDTPRQRAARYHPAVTVRRKAIEQNNLVVAFPGLSYLDERRYQLLLLNAILGGGVSSRLFQQLREERGLCYSVYSYVADHADTGLLGIYTGLGQETEGAALETIRRVVDDLAQHGPTADELDRAREQAKAAVVMGLESVQARMSHLGTGALLGERVRTPEELEQAYDAVTAQQVRDLAGALLDFSNASLSAVGRVRAPEEYAKILGTRALDGKNRVVAPALG